jgi:hypothetical protein
MADTPSTGETVTPTAPKNDATPTTPQLEEKKTEDSEIETLRKAKEQAEMRANQLANQLKAKDEAEAQSKAGRVGTKRRI